MLACQERVEDQDFMIGAGGNPCTGEMMKNRCRVLAAPQTADWALVTEFVILRDALAALAQWDGKLEKAFCNKAQALKHPRSGNARNRMLKKGFQQR
jgi:hypothetical protein